MQKHGTILEPWASAALHNGRRDRTVSYKDFKIPCVLYPLDAL